MSLATVDALLVLQRSDVQHLAAHRERYADASLLCIDPGNLETVLQAGFGNFALRRIDPGADMPARVYSETVARADLIDLLLTRERQRLWGAGCWHGWDRGAMFQPLHVMVTAQALRPAIERALPEPRLGLLRPDNPLLFNFDSMVQPEILAADARRWCIVDRYPAGRLWNPLLLDTCFDFDAIAERAAQGPVQALTHLGSCFYDVECFGKAVELAFDNNIDLPSVYVDVPVRRGRLLLTAVERLHARWRNDSTTEYRERARQILATQLADLLPSRQALDQQVDALARRCELQAINFLGLRQALQGQRPHLVIADHDNGHLGPLFSLADSWGSAITVLPHSGYTNSRLPHNHRVTAIERDGYGVRVATLLGQPVATRSVRYRPAVQPQLRPALRKVCILVNTMYSDGQYAIDLFGLIHLYKALREVCARRGGELSLRLKPSTPALNVVCGGLGMQPDVLLRAVQQPIAELARDTDLCLAWDELTTGCINFLDAASLVLHTSQFDWPGEGAPQAPFLGDGLVSTMRSDAALTLVDALFADPAEYRRLQQAQAERYAQRRAGAHDTIFPTLSTSGA